MKRREFITLLGGAAAAWPLAARAQQSERVRRVGVLMSAAANDREAPARIASFLGGLQQLGWIEGRNIRIDIRWAAGDLDFNSKKYAAELVALAPDVLLATAGPTVAALQAETRSVPIVFAHAVDPVGAGFVASLARPNSNATGFILFEFSIGAKWLELLKEVAPNVMRVAVLRDPTSAAGIGQFAAIQAVASSFGVELSTINVRNPDEIETAIGIFARSAKRRPDCSCKPSSGTASRADNRPRNSAQASRNLFRTVSGHRWRPDVLRARSGRSVSSRGQLRRPHSQERKGSRSARASTDKV